MTNHATRRLWLRQLTRTCVRLTCELGILALLASTLASPARATTGADADLLTYEPYGLVHNRHSAADVDGYLHDLDSYGIGQALLQTPRLKPNGHLHEPKHDRVMLARWADRAATYNATHSTDITVTAVFNGEVSASGGGLDLNDRATRSRLIAGIESVLSTGVGAVHLDLEPFPMTSGYLDLLREIDQMFVRAHFDGRLSVVSSGFTLTWTPAYLQRVSRLVDQIDPMYYDSEFTTVADYAAWIVDSLAYYTAHAAPRIRIVPVLPAYSRNRWHRPSVENIETATSALSTALTHGSRVNGAGIWWWWGFFYDEDGAYDASVDRSAWQADTRRLPFSD